MTEMDPQAFAAKWKGTITTERAAAQEHFLDICKMLDEASPQAGSTSRPAA